MTAPRTAGTVKSRRERKNISPLKEAARFAQETFGWKVDFESSKSCREENWILGLFCLNSSMTLSP